MWRLTFFLHPVFDEAEALAGISHRKVRHPTAKHWIDQFNDPIHRLRLEAAEHILELPQQRRSFLELGRVVRTPHAPTTANASEVESQEAKAFASAEVYVSTLLSSLISTCSSGHLPKPFSTAPISQSCRGWASIKITRSSANLAYSM